MSLCDEINMFWMLLIIIISTSLYIVGWLCYKLGYRDGESAVRADITRRIDRSMLKRGTIRRIR